MIKKIKAYLVSAIALLTFLAPAIAAPAMVHAQDLNTIKNGVNCGSNLELNTSGKCADVTGKSVNQIQNLIKLVINVFSVVVGIIAIIMIIIGGIRFILSGGDSAATGSARNTVLYAVIGLIVVALAQIIVHFVLNRVNTTIT